MFDRVQHLGIPVNNIDKATSFLIENLNFENIFETILDPETDPIKIVFLKYGNLYLEFYEVKDTVLQKVGNIDYIAMNHNNKLKEGLFVTPENIRFLINYNADKQGLDYIAINTENMKATESFLKEVGFEIMNQIAQKNHVIFKINETKDVNKLGNGVIDHIALNAEDVNRIFGFIKENGIRHQEDIVTFLPFFKKGVRYITSIGPNNLKLEFNEYL